MQSSFFAFFFFVFRFGQTQRRPRCLQSHTSLLLQKRVLQLSQTASHQVSAVDLRIIDFAAFIRCYLLRAALRHI
jgi:hypothetical protein